MLSSEFEMLLWLVTSFTRRMRPHPESRWMDCTPYEGSEQFDVAIPRRSRCMAVANQLDRRNSTIQNRQRRTGGTHLEKLIVPAGQHCVLLFVRDACFNFEIKERAFVLSCCASGTSPFLENDYLIAVLQAQDEYPAGNIRAVGAVTPASMA